MIPSQTLLRGLARHARRLTPLPPISAAETSASASGSATIPTATRERARIGEYTISRSTGGELPVYSEHTRGTVWKTIVRKIDVSLLLGFGIMKLADKIGRCHGQSIEDTVMSASHTD